MGFEKQPHTFSIFNSHSWAFGPPINHEKFGGTGFQPVRRTGKMPVPPRTFQGREPFMRTDSMAWGYLLLTAKR
jgi:hypothetical protein